METLALIVFKRIVAKSGQTAGTHLSCVAEAFRFPSSDSDDI